MAMTADASPEEAQRTDGYNSDATAVAVAIDEMTTGSGPTLILTGRGPGVRLAEIVSQSTESRTEIISNVASRDINQLLADSAAATPTLIVGVGGGQVIERMKIVAQVAAAASLAVPTSLSQDGLFAPTAVITLSGNRTQRYNCESPTQVVAALDLIDTAAARYRTACVADLISNLSAIEDCRIAADRGEGCPSEDAIQLAHRAAMSAARSNPAGSASELLDAVQKSGQAMALSGDSRPCSGAEHKIAHVLSEIVDYPVLHGLAVGVATSFVARLRDDAHVEQIDAYLRFHGIPRSPSGIGVSEDDFVTAVQRAQHWRRSRVTILDVLEPTEAMTRAVLRSQEFAP